MSTVKSQNDSQEIQSYAFVNGTEALEKEQQVTNALLNSMMEELEELLSGTDITSLSDVEDHSVPEKFQKQFQQLEQTMRGMVDNYKNDNGGNTGSFSTSVKSSLIEMTKMLSELNAQMEESEVYNLNIQSQMLMAEQNQAQDQYKKAEHHHGFFGHMIKALTYVVQAATITACIVTGNVAMAVALVALSVMMDTKAGQALEQGLEAAGLPPIAAKAVEALIIVVVVVALAATGNLLTAGEALEGEVGSAVAEEGASVAADAASEAESEAGEVADEAKKGKSLGKTLAGIGLMTGSTTLLENNFVASVVKHMNNHVLRDFIGAILMLLEMVGAAYGGYSAMTSGADSSSLTSSLQSLSEVSDGVRAGDTEAIEKMAQTVMKMAKYAAGGAMALQGTAEIGVSINQGFVAKAMENIYLLNQSQQTTRHMIKDGTDFIDEIEKEFNQYFENVDLSSILDTLTKIFNS